MPLIACAAAAASMLVVPPDRALLAALDLRTLVLLGALLAVVTALHGAGFFVAAAAGVGRGLRTARSAAVVLVLVSAVCSALFTNDVALLALLPLAAALLLGADARPALAPVFVLMTAAANLGGMITPFGSPQNLFLFTRFEFGIGEFIAALAVPFAVSVVAILVLCLIVPAIPLTGSPSRSGSGSGRPTGAVGPDAAEPRRERSGRGIPPRTWIALALFGVIALVVLRLLPLWVVALALPVLLAIDRGVLRRMDWGLLVTFAAFFVFAANAARMPGVERAVTVLFGGGEVLGSALASQVISNVPAAILLAPFSADPLALLVGVNVGGVGTLIASLASLIALSELRRAAPGESRRFLVVFTWVNLLLLAILLAVTIPLR